VFLIFIVSVLLLAAAEVNRLPVVRVVGFTTRWFPTLVSPAPSPGRSKIERDREARAAHPPASPPAFLSLSPSLSEDAKVLKMFRTGEKIFVAVNNSGLKLAAAFGVRWLDTAVVAA
jgi:hypothetical protein